MTFLVRKQPRALVTLGSVVCPPPAVYGASERERHATVNQGQVTDTFALVFRASWPSPRQPRLRRPARSGTMNSS